MDAMLEAALGYAEMGYRVFPCEPGGKKPATEHGCLDASSDLDVVEAWWTERPDCNIGLSTEGLLVVDIDGKDNPWLSSIGDKIDDLMACPAAWTPRGGQHLYFRQPEGEWRNTAGVVADRVDTRASGGYVVAPPSNRAEGGGYRWFPDRELERFLEEPPEWLLDLLRKNVKRPAGPRREYAPEEPIGEGRRNQVLTSIAGSMRRIGLSEAAMLAGLQSVNCDRCKPPLEIDEVRRIAASVARYEPDQVAKVMAEGGGFDAEPPKRVGPFPQELLYPPGLIERVMDFNLDGAHRQQPILALAGALALLSVITGRKVCDESGVRTNLYIVSVGPSAGGKERARKVNKRLLYAAGGGDMIGPEAPASATGIVSALHQSPAMLFQFDEVGRLLKTVTAQRAAPHLAGIATTLMKLYSSADDIFLGDAYADAKKNTAIDQPHAVLYGTTVPGHFFDSLTIEAISDGFLNRMLVFESEDVAPEYMSPTVAKPPAELVDEVRAWVEEKQPGNLSGQHPEPRLMATTAEARSIYRELLDECLRRERDTSDPYASLWGRAGEKARKLGLLHACSRREAVVDAEAARWGVALSTYLTERLGASGREWVAETPHHAACLRAYRWLAGQRGPVSRNDLSRCALRHLKRPDREAVLADLLEFHGVTIELEATGGRPVERIGIRRDLFALRDKGLEGLSRSAISPDGQT